MNSLREIFVSFVNSILPFHMFLKESVKYIFFMVVKNTNMRETERDSKLEPSLTVR